MTKFLYIGCGIPGSGKSTLFSKMENENTVRVSRDEIRFSIINDNDEYFSKENDVWREFVRQIQMYLDDDIHTAVIADATHLNKKARMKLINALNLKGVNVVPVNFIISLDLAKERNALRTGRSLVPESAMESMYNSFVPAAENEYNYAMILNKVVE